MATLTKPPYISSTVPNLPIMSSSIPTAFLFYSSSSISEITANDTSINRSEKTLTNTVISAIINTNIKEISGKYQEGNIMLVKDVITAIESRELSIKQLAEQYNVSDKTVQNRIKSLGFKWIPKQTKYEFTGEDTSVMAIEFDSLFNSPPAPRKKSNSTSSTKRKVIKPDSSSQAETEQKQAETEELDVIDMLLSGKKQNSQRVYRGFYFDKDVLSIVDKAGNKSELINQALRKVFKDKGLL